MADFFDFRSRAERMQRLARERAAAAEDDDVTVIDTPVATAEQRRRNIDDLQADVRRVMDADALRLVLACEGYPRHRDHDGKTELETMAQRFVADNNLRLMVMAGDTGRGKTVAATWVAATLGSTYWLPARMVTVSDEWSSRASRAINAALTVIDDLGVETNDWASSELGRIIEARFDMGRRTVVTTNLPMSSLTGKNMSRYGDRLVSRLAQVPLARYRFVHGPDLRST